MYTLKIKRQFASQGRQIKNIGGTIVVFRGGVATGVSEHVAQIARKQHYIDSIIEEVQPAAQAVPEVPEVEEVVEEEVVQEVEEVGEEEDEELEEPEVETQEVVEDSIEVNESVVADVEETEDSVLTAEEIQALYDKLGTWSAVADYLEISTATLRKYRDEVGLL